MYIQCDEVYQKGVTMLYETAKAELSSPPQAIPFMAMAMEASLFVVLAAGLLLIV
jgi:hypothetical protein